jgi:hypothetical protein
VGSKVQYIVDESGNRTHAIIPIDDYKRIIDELEDADDVRVYDEAKKDDDGERVLLADYLKSRG